MSEVSDRFRERGVGPRRREPVTQEPRVSNTFPTPHPAPTGDRTLPAFSPPRPGVSLRCHSESTLRGWVRPSTLTYSAVSRRARCHVSGLVLPEL